MTERPHTPPVLTPTGGKRITVQRACNGCGREIGDATKTELLAAVHIGEMPDVRDECGCIATPQPPPSAAPEPRSTPRPSTGTPEPSQAASEALADSWDKGYASGFSNAMRRMSDEPQAPTTPNPFRAVLASVDAPAPDEADEPECACYVTPESTWLSAASCGYGSGYEPGSQMEWNPDCPLHPGTPAAPAVPAEGDESR